MLHTCLNCNHIASFPVPRELVEQQIGWKQDMPLKRTIAERHRQEDVRSGVVHLCRECYLGIIKLEMATASILQ